jgi:hypothetical protein
VWPSASGWPIGRAASFQRGGDLLHQGIESEGLLDERPAGFCKTRYLIARHEHDFPKFPHLRELKRPHPPGSLRGLGGADEASLELVLEPVGIASDVQRDGVVEDAVQDRGGDDPVAEDLPPAAETLVAGQDHGAALVAAAGELKEQVRHLPINGQIADLVHNEQAGHGVDLELVVQAPLGEGAGEGGNEDGGRGEEHAVTVLDALEPEPDGEMGLADAGRAEDHQVLAVLR